MDNESIALVSVVSQLEADSVVIAKADDPRIFGIGALSGSAARKHVAAYSLGILFTEAGGSNNLLCPGQKLSISNAFSGNTVPDNPLSFGVNAAVRYSIRQFSRKSHLARCLAIENAIKENNNIKFALSISEGQVAVKGFILNCVLTDQALED